MRNSNLFHATTIPNDFVAQFHSDWSNFMIYHFNYMTAALYMYLLCGLFVYKYIYLFPYLYDNYKIQIMYCPFATFMLVICLCTAVGLESSLLLSLFLSPSLPLSLSLLLSHTYTLSAPLLSWLIGCPSVLTIPLCSIMLGIVFSLFVCLFVPRYIDWWILIVGEPLTSILEWSTAAIRFFNFS